MLRELERFFKTHLAFEETAPEEENPHQLDIATAVLFLEIAYADFNMSSEEFNQMQVSLKEFLKLNENELEEVLQAADEARKNRQDLWYFTNQIKEHYSKSQKLQLMEKLWQLIYADGSVHKYEDALIRKLTNLLGMDHGDMIEAKLKARETFNKTK